MRVGGHSPWELEVETHADVYEWRAEKRRRGECPTTGEVNTRRLRARRLMLAKWEEALEEPSAGHKTIEAIRPVLTEWLSRGRGPITFRLAQVLTGHGCFGRYLCRIGRERRTDCHHCSGYEDTAQHTLEVCSAFEQGRRILRTTVGNDLSLPAVVRAMVGSESAWMGMLTFCEDTVSQKEAAEREREIASSAPAYRRRRRRMNRRARP
ncbi:uncharacterized protein ACR2FA_000259 [Aphomia sociella]